MYIDVVPNRNSRPAILLREAWREGTRIRKRTLANLSDWSPDQVEAFRRVLKGHKLVAVDDVFSIERSLPHGHVQAVLETIGRLGLDKMISSRRCRERDLVIAMIAEQLINPCSKLATTRTWHTTTLAEELAVADADEDELYAALDWLHARQGSIEKKLAAKHLGEGSTVLYDVSSSYYEGRTCPLVRHGHNCDRKKGRPIVVYGVMTDGEGRPVAVQVYPGNTVDSKTVPDQVEKLRERFGLTDVMLVGDRGMLTRTQIAQLREHPGLSWISALRSREIRDLAERSDLQMSLFDQRNLAEITSSEYPGERLIACMNPYLAEERRRKREDLMAATEQSLARIAKEVSRRTRKPLDRAEIAMKVGKVIQRYKMSKHFLLEIGDGEFVWRRNDESIAREAALDGIYVLRTNAPAEKLTAPDVVRRYKSLSQVEHLFRTLKSIDLQVRPIRHHREERVRAHILLCMLAYYVEWHMRRALAPLLFEDETLPTDRWQRDPVAPAEAGEAAKSKKAKRTTAMGEPVHSFRTLLQQLATCCRNRCRMTSDAGEATFDRLSDPTPLQRQVFELLSCTQ
jgi:transposase